MITRRMVLAGALALSGCADGGGQPALLASAPPVQEDGVFTMADGAVLPYRHWLPAGRPDAVVLALHGMNDSRDAWEVPGPELAAAGIAVFGPDQRGFGLAPHRGLWPGSDLLASDAATMAATLRRRYPRTRLVLMGESMGGAVLMHMVGAGPRPEVDGYVLIAPAVWGRAEMNIFLTSGLWMISHLMPAASASRAPGVRVIATDNRAALIRLSTDPLTLHATRFDTLRGLVNLMDDALAAAPRFRERGLFLYGGKDDLIPPQATAETWRQLQGQDLGFYPEGHHLLLRDLERAPRIADVAAWVRGERKSESAFAAAENWLTKRA